MPYNATSTLADIAKAEQNFNNFLFNKFVVICENDCFADVGLFGRKRLINKIPSRNTVIQEFQFWYQTDPNFATNRFSRFLSSLVEFGLYDLAVKRFRKLERLRFLLGRMDALGLSRLGKGSLFSYIFLKPIVNAEPNEENPSKVTAFTGLFLMSGCFIVASLIVWVLELL